MHFQYVSPKPIVSIVCEGLWSSSLSSALELPEQHPCENKKNWRHLYSLKKTFSLLHGSGHFLSVIAPFGWFDVVGNFSWRFTIFPSLFVFPARRRSFVLDLNRSKIVDQQSSFLFYSQPVQCSRTFWGTNFDGGKHIFIPFPPFLWNHRTKDVEIPLRHIKFELAKATTFMGNLASSVIHPLRFEMSIYGTFKSFMPLRIQNPW